MKARILVVDDDELLSRTLRYRLTHEDYTVVIASNRDEAINLARSDHPDLVILDIGLPEQDGFQVARALRSEFNLPIIFLSARNQETDVVTGLELGAEDYITKPFRMRELLARIRVVLRRVTRAPLALGDEPLEADGIRLDPKSHEVWLRDAQIELPPKEFELLRLLMANVGTVLSTDYLLEAVWGEDFVGAVQVLYVHIGWLRERIEPDPRHPHYIQTVRGIGYKFGSGGRSV